MARYTLIFATILAASKLAAACFLPNEIKQDEIHKQENTNWCQTMGPDRWTFTMTTSEVAVPTFDPDNMWAGLSTSVFFEVYDNDCMPRGWYAKPGDCGLPWEIQEDFLPYVIVIKSIFTDVGAPDFTFAYANGDYMIGENQCICRNVSQGLQAKQACSCSFPIDGEPE
jgi:hypothetical protein